MTDFIGTIATVVVCTLVALVMLAPIVGAWINWCHRNDFQDGTSVVPEKVRREVSRKAA